MNILFPAKTKVCLTVYLQFWNNAVAKQYGIRAIPQNFLLDPEGKIIAKNVRGEELDQKVGEALQQKGF